jgi:hypothetical protein
VLQGSTANLSYDWFGNNTNDYIVPSGTPVDHVWNDERSGGYAAPSAPDYDFHLKAESPVINLATGSTLTTDLDFQARPVFNVSDLGAYEFSIPALIANRTNISTITDKNQTITAFIHISATSGENIEWIADTNADWITLGPSGSGNQASGETESDLIVTLDTSKVNMGLNSATISVTSASADLLSSYSFGLNSIFLSSEGETLRVDCFFSKFINLRKRTVVSHFASFFVL